MSVSATTNPSSVSQDQQEAATLFFANRFAADADLQHLYDTACNRIGRGKFVRNNRRLLNELNRDLRQEASGPMHGQVIRFLGSRRIRTTISHHILQTFETSATVSISALLRNKNDQIVDVERWLGTFDDSKMTANSGNYGQVPHDGNVRSDDGNSNASSDNSSQDDEELIFNKPNSDMTPRLTNMTQFIISGPAFEAYKKNLAAFIEPNAPLAPLKPSVSDEQKDDAETDEINATDEESVCKAQIEEHPTVGPDGNAALDTDSSGTATLPRTATLLSKLEFYLTSLFQPPALGYERVSFVCVGSWLAGMIHHLVLTRIKPSRAVAS